MAVERFAEQLAQLPMHEAEREVGGDIGELGHAFDDFAQGCHTADVADDQRRHHALAQLAQGAFEALVAVRCGGGKKVGHLPGGEWRGGVFLEPVGDLRADGEQIAQVAAVRLRRLPGWCQYAGAGGMIADGVHSSLAGGCRPVRHYRH
ncbi:MAG: hypothetical protein AW09_002749 [Candidatus Accumulibacter phosphatis]|uniref:Uncharacterized protein n=1 Tax=Candidatus Accumulibacter phosphatis TaxID=327160 RepID=A0A080LWD5_9PROT|nr:MAG: hypothetical protein AW09_002749 [Candidatus Accumulibacter phosphatis]